MAFTTITEVKQAITFSVDPGTANEIPDSLIAVFIKQSQDEIELTYKTKFRTIEYDNLSASVVSNDSITFASSTSYTPKPRELIDQVLYVSSGPGAGLYRGITGNEGNAINISPDLPSTGRPDTNSTYQILTLGYAHDEFHDSTALYNFFVNEIPLVYVMKLEHNGSVIDANDFYTFNTGEISLKNGEKFILESDYDRQGIKVDYIYGEYVTHPVIIRLATVLTAMKVLRSILSGQYKEYDGVGIPGLNSNKIAPHMKLKTAIDAYKEEAQQIKYPTDGSIPMFRPFTVVV